jgi:hypothetical protein
MSETSRLARCSLSAGSFGSGAARLQAGASRSPRPATANLGQGNPAVTRQWYKPASPKMSSGTVSARARRGSPSQSHRRRRDGSVWTDPCCRPKHQRWRDRRACCIAPPKQQSAWLAPEAPDKFQRSIDRRQPFGLLLAVDQPPVRLAARQASTARRACRSIADARAWRFLDSGRFGLEAVAGPSGTASGRGQRVFFGLTVPATGREDRTSMADRTGSGVHRTRQD